MIGQRIGYVRVSALDQNPGRQLERIPVDRTFADKASGKRRRLARPRPVSARGVGERCRPSRRGGRTRGDTLRDQGRVGEADAGAGHSRPGSRQHG